uniref:LapA_dom domain-containing protein n=1 Tax=Panagrellus redivivus TaxID=6233 RepID=A0A7E4V5A5_PANRE
MGNNVFKSSEHTGMGSWYHEHNMVIIFVLSIPVGLTLGILLWALFRGFQEIRLNRARSIRHRASKQLNAYYARRIKYKLPTVCEIVELSMNAHEGEESKKEGTIEQTTVTSITADRSPAQPQLPSKIVVTHKVEAKPVKIDPKKVDDKKMK